MEQQPNAIDDLDNELKRFRKEWLEEMAAEKETKKEEGSKTTAVADKSTADADGQKV